MSQTSASAYKALTGAAPSFPSRNTLGCVCGPVAPSDEDSGSARTIRTVPRESVGAPDIIPAGGGAALAEPRPRDAAGHLCWAGPTGKKSPSPALLPEAVVSTPSPPPPACPPGSSVNVDSNREPGRGVWRGNVCHQGHPQTLRCTLSLSGVQVANAARGPEDTARPGCESLLPLAGYSCLCREVMCQAQR